MILKKDSDKKQILLNTFKCNIYTKPFKKQAFLERHITKVHINYIPQVDGTQDSLGTSLYDLFECIDTHEDDIYNEEVPKNKSYAECILCNILLINKAVTVDYYKKEHNCFPSCTKFFLYLCTIYFII